MCSGGGSPEQGATGEAWAQLTFVPGQTLAQGASLVLPATRLARAEGLGKPALIILFLAHSGCFWPSF